MQARRAIAMTMASTAAVLLAGCSTHATARPSRDSSLGSDRSVTAAVRSAPIAAPAYPAVPPDEEGNPACPVADSWGQAPTDDGIFVTYWDNQADDVTALVRTSIGMDFAKSASIDALQQPLIFDFPHIHASDVREVLITTNIKRCFATPDPATSGR
jgi:hypothetical protein